MPKKQPRRRRSWSRIFLLILFVAAALTGIYKSVVRPMELPTKEETPTQEDAASQSSTDPSAEDAAAQAALAAHTERKPNFFTILVSGVDDGNGGSDTNILVAIDADGGSIHCVSIPRDTKAIIDGKAHKINYAYNHGGSELLADTISAQLGIPVDFTVTVGLKGFQALVDAIGGVDFYVPVDMDYDDPTQDLHIHFQQGQQHLTGDEALEVVRFREGYASQDLGRMETQQKFLKAVAKQVLKPGNVAKVATFAKIFQKYVDTDLTLGNLAWLGQEAFSMGSDNISFTTLSGTWKSPYIHLDPDAVLQLVNESLNPYVEDRTAADLDIPS